MIPLRLTRQSAPVEAVQLVSGADLDPVWTWLTEWGLEVEIHDHGILIYADGPISVDFGDWITIGPSGKPQRWDTAELRAEHDGLPA